MASRKPLILLSGASAELPPGDTVVGAQAGILTAGSGLAGGGDLSTNQRVDVSLAAAPSGLIFVGNQLGIDGSAQASGNAALSSAATAQASGNAALASASTALASGNAALSSAATALASGNQAQNTANTALASGNAALSSAATRVSSSGGLISGALTLDNQNSLRFREAAANGTNYVGLQAPSSVGSDLIWTLPASDGSSGQVLQTNGGGVLSFATPSAGKVVQVNYGFSSSSQYTLSTSYQPGPVSAAITPTSASNYILIIVNSSFYYTYQCALFRNGSYLANVKGTSSTPTTPDYFCFTYMDYPSSTSSTSYQLYFTSNSSYYAYLGYDTTSTMTLMEIKIP